MQNLHERVYMNGSVDVGSLVNAAVYIVPLIALMVSIATFTNASKERHAKTASEAAEIKAELHMLTVQVEELKDNSQDSQDGYHKNSTRITKLEEQVKTLWNKMSDIERKLNNVN